MSDELRELLARAAEHATAYLESVPERPVAPQVDLPALRAALGGPTPEGPTPAENVLDDLARVAGDAAVNAQSGRYFGFVTGGAMPVTVAADWLTSAWDQNGGLFLAGAPAAFVEQIAGEWLADILGLPSGVSVGFVTGTQTAHVTALAAARNHVLSMKGWDVAEQGLRGAPPVRIVAGAKRHVTLDRAVRLIGLGNAAIVEVAADERARMRADALRDELARDPDAATIVVAQAGEVNTGTFDPLREIVTAAREVDAWVHVDGAFGLWAAASPSFRPLLDGHDGADSWACDAHKWLNVPYDCGLVFCAHPAVHRAAMTMGAAYLMLDADVRQGFEWVPEASRRARGFTVYAALRALGRRGVADLVDRCCAHARRLGEELARFDRCEVLNEVVLNQVLFRFEDDERTRAILRRVQESGEAWMGGTTWDGRAAIRISVSNWQTSDDDVTRTVAAFARAAAG